MTTQNLLNTLKQGKPMTDKLMREIVRELEEKNEQLHTMATALRAKDADYAALREAARPVAEWWKYKDTHCDVMPVPMLLGRLAALVGVK